MKDLFTKQESVKENLPSPPAEKMFENNKSSHKSLRSIDMTKQVDTVSNIHTSPMQEKSPLQE